MNEVVKNPIFGQVYMANRHYNSKRIVYEPFRLTHANPPNPQMMTHYKYGGEWVMDGKKAYVISVYTFNPKWVSRKVQEIVEEVGRLNSHADNLRTLMT